MYVEEKNMIYDQRKYFHVEVPRWNPGMSAFHWAYPLMYVLFSWDKVEGNFVHLPNTSLCHVWTLKCRCPVNCTGVVDNIIREGGRFYDRTFYARDMWRITESVVIGYAGRIICYASWLKWELEVSK